MKYYAIRTGRKDNVVVESWGECSNLVTGYPKAVFKSFQPWEYDEALRFAKEGKYRNPGVVKSKVKPKKQSKILGKCLQRKSYTDIFTGEYYNNRCIEREYKTITGIDFIESTDTSCPF